MENTQMLRFALMQRLTAAHPNTHSDNIEAMASAIEQTRAYKHDGVRLVPVGTQAQLAQAQKISPSVCGQITREYVEYCSSASSAEAKPLDSARARLKALGINMDQALRGEADDDSTFMGVDLSTITPKGAA